MSREERGAGHRTVMQRVRTPSIYVAAAVAMSGMAFGGVKGVEALTYSPPPAVSAQASLVTQTPPGTDSVNVSVTNNRGTPERITVTIRAWSPYDTLNGVQASVATGSVGTTHPGSPTVDLGVVAPHSTVRTRLVGPDTQLQRGGAVEVAVNGAASSSVDF